MEDLDQPPNTEDKKTIWSVIRQQAPNTIYYCIQGQSVIFIISFFGKTRNIAEMGALGRLTTLFALVNSVMAAIVVPRFACCHERNKLKKIFLHTLFTLAILSILLMAVSILLPGPFLWLLGSKYAYLRRELAYATFSTVVYAFGGAIYSLNASRGLDKKGMAIYTNYHCRPDRAGSILELE